MLLPIICISASILTASLILLGAFGIVQITLLTAILPNLVVAAVLLSHVAFIALITAYNAIVIYCLTVHAVLTGEAYRFGFGQSLFQQPFDFSATPIE